MWRRSFPLAAGKHPTDTSGAKMTARYMYPLPGDDRAAQARRLRRFSIGNAFVSFATGLAICALAAMFRSLPLGIIGILACGIGVIYLVALRAAGRDNIETAVAMIC